ncbi:MAG: hypothetical protein JSS32_00660 [Verrucomicrobia bacterium]|nr:hypothetical protein [Verrucomicrobiota bacterium]
MFNDIRSAVDTGINLVQAGWNQIPTSNEVKAAAIGTYIAASAAIGAGTAQFLGFSPLIGASVVGGIVVTQVHIMLALGGIVIQGVQRDMEENPQNWRQPQFEIFDLFLSTAM